MIHITPEVFNIFLTVMALTGLVVFVALFFVRAGYGVFFDRKWGPPLPNRLGWFLMEAPIFIMMTVLWLCSERRWEVVPLLFFAIFQTHYLQRSFIFPWLIRGNSRMALGIVAMGMVFNTCNALMQGGWIFYFSPRYSVSWLWSPQFIAGTALFFAGFVINLHSDYIIRHLRAPGDTRHYIPRGGMFRYVSSANYFGEAIEWIGFAVLTWSWAGAVFAWWTLANLAPRADAIWRNYRREFGEDFTSLKLKRMIPFIY
jgi:3-oxo-5-alpha-steroid 4-dehydrogenase 1